MLLLVWWNGDLSTSFSFCLIFILFYLTTGMFGIDLLVSFANVPVRLHLVTSGSSQPLVGAACLKIEICLKVGPSGHFVCIQCQWELEDLQILFDCFIEFLLIKLNFSNHLYRTLW